MRTAPDANGDSASDPGAGEVRDWTDLGRVIRHVARLAASVATEDTQAVGPTEQPTAHQN